MVLSMKVKRPYEMPGDGPRQPPRSLPALFAEIRSAAGAKLLDRLAAAGHPRMREGYSCVFGFIDTDGGSRLTDLAERSGLTKQAVGEVVVELERIGYVRRCPDPADRRAKVITLTARGRDGCAAARRLAAEIESEWAAQLGDDLVAQLREAAERVAEIECPNARSAPAADRASSSSGPGRSGRHSISGASRRR